MKYHAQISLKTKKDLSSAAEIFHASLKSADFFKINFFENFF